MRDTRRLRDDAISILEHRINEEALSECAYTLEAMGYKIPCVPIIRIWKWQKMIDRLKKGDDPRILLYEVVATE